MNHSSGSHTLGMNHSTPTLNPDLVRTDRGPFGLPTGLPGRFAGRLMAANDAQQRELSELIELSPCGSLCEVGYGPGVLLRLLRARFPEATFSGVDPSTVMLRQALRANAGARMDLRTAAVGDLPFDDHTFDMTVSANTIQFWPDLTAGLREVRRVTRPGGQVLIAWHGGTAPTRFQRRLVLDPSELTNRLSAVREHIGKVERTQLSQSELFSAVVGDAGC